MGNMDAIIEPIFIENTLKRACEIWIIYGIANLEMWGEKVVNFMGHSKCASNANMYKSKSG